MSRATPQTPPHGAATTKAAPLVAIAAGGTGGHVFPAEALAAELRGRGCRLVLITDRRGQSYGGTLGAIDTRRIAAGGIAGRGMLGRLGGMVELALGMGQALVLMARLRPAVVVGFGGYASLPPMLAARQWGIPTLVHEQNALPGRANRLLARRVTRFAVGFAGSPPPPGVTPVVTGMPMREAVLALRDAPYTPPEPEGPVRLLVTGGSQGARVFSSLVPEAVALLPAAARARLRITQQCRPEDLEDCRARYAALGVEATLSPFFADLPRHLDAAHLVICRAGASTMGELAIAGRPALLVPYPHAIDDHQTANARLMDEAGGGWLMPQAPLTPQTLADRLAPLMEGPEVLARAATCARALGLPDAAERLADLALATAGIASVSSSDTPGDAS